MYTLKNNTFFKLIFQILIKFIYVHMKYYQRLIFDEKDFPIP